MDMDLDLTKTLQKEFREKIPETIYVLKSVLLTLETFALYCMTFFVIFPRNPSWEQGIRKDKYVSYVCVCVCVSKIRQQQLSDKPISRVSV